MQYKSRLSSSRDTCPGTNPQQRGAGEEQSSDLIRGLSSETELSDVVSVSCSRQLALGSPDGAHQASTPCGWGPP